METTKRELEVTKRKLAVTIWFFTVTKRKLAVTKRLFASIKRKMETIKRFLDEIIMVFSCLSLYPLLYKEEDVLPIDGEPGENERKE